MRKGKFIKTLTLRIKIRLNIFIYKLAKYPSIAFYLYLYSVLYLNLKGWIYAVQDKNTRNSVKVFTQDLLAEISQFAEVIVNEYLKRKRSGRSLA